MARYLRLILRGILFIVILAACSQSPISVPSGSTDSTTAPTSQPVSAASGGCTNAYYPVSSGATWSYSSSGNSLGSYTYTQTVSAISDNEFTTDYQFSTGVKTAFKWNCQDGNLAALDAGNNSFNMTTSSVTMTSDSITADGYNIPASFDIGNTWSEKVTVIGTVTSNSTAKTVTSQIVTQISCSVAGTDKITVPAGTYDTVKATCNKSVGVSAIVQGTPMPEGVPATASITYWYAKGVGVVQSVSTSSNNGTETIVLTQYSK